MMPSPLRHQQHGGGGSNGDGGNDDGDDEDCHRAFLESLRAEEAAVLRECLYALQGISGERIRFFWNRKDDYHHDHGDLQLHEEGVHVRSAAVRCPDSGPPPPIPPAVVHRSQLGAGAIDGLRLCGEAGWLYARALAFVSEILQPTEGQPTTTTAAEGGGAVARALAGAVEEELQSYRNFLARFDTGSHERIAATSSSLRQILVDVQPCLPRLKTLAMLADGLRNASSGSGSGSGSGGADILTALWRHSRSGDQRHARLVQRLWTAASRPWLRMVHAWITQGTLPSSSRGGGGGDRDGEFFVVDAVAIQRAQQRYQHDDGDDDERDINTKFLWRDRYRVDRSKVPMGNIDRDLVDPAFLVGKGINYIHKCLLDGGWSLQDHLLLEGGAEMDGPDMDFDSLVDPSSPSDVMPNLRAQIETAASIVHSHILLKLRDEYSLMQHLFALKQFLLLGQGDFFSALMDGIHAEYGNRQGIAGIYKHNLTALVDTALRSTNASGFPPFILKRLEVELLLDRGDDASFTFGEPKDRAGTDEKTVWDIFSLRYTLPDPLVAIVPPSTMALYKRMFQFLFGLRRVSFSLSLTWRQSAVLQHALQTSAQRNAVKVTTSPSYAQANVLLRKISMMRQSMMHFVTNLTSYLMFEVLEGGWKHLVRSIEEATTLDEVIKAHAGYLTGICQKSLLPTDDNALAIDDEDGDLGDRIQELLLVASEFCLYQEQLFGDALEEAERAEEKRRKAEERMTHGDWGFQAGVEEADEENTFFGLADADKFTDLDLISDMFNELAMGLLKALDRRLYGAPAIKTPDAASTPVSPTTTCTQPRNEQYDLDSLRFLAFQLDNNNYYGLQENE